VTLQIGLSTGLRLHQVVTAVDQQDLRVLSVLGPGLRTD
jgi:hypothetical protein